MGLWYPKDTGFELTAFSDLDHAGCLDSRKSTSGGIQFLGGDKLVSWSSKKQDCTSMSLAEADTCEDGVISFYFFLSLLHCPGLMFIISLSLYPFTERYAQPYSFHVSYGRLMFWTHVSSFKLPLRLCMLNFIMGADGRYINAPCYCNEALTIPYQTAHGKDISNPLMAGSLPKTTKPTY
ncbi:hypothetical protein Tco_0478392 [Tanacetum coccineum]